jgi:prevent-host-death family protein
MSIHITEDIRSVTELKRNMKEVFAHLHKTKRPVILTVNGKADALLMDAKTYEKQMVLLAIAEGERDIAAGRTRPMREFLEEIKREYKIQD